MENLTLKEAINEYINQLDDVCENTINQYTLALNNFAQIDKELRDIGYDDLYRYLQDNYGNKKASTYQKQYIILNCFFKYCVSEEYIPKVPLKKRWRKKIGEHLPRYLDRVQVADLMIVVEKLKIRDRTIINLLLDSGIRVQELCNIGINDLDLNNCSVQVTGKGSKTRTAHFTTNTKLLLEKLISMAPPSQNEVFVNFRGQKINKKSVYNITVTLGRYIGLPRNLTPHIFRHTMATWLLNNGVDITSIAELLGHESIQTTEIYAKLMDDDLRLKYHKLIG